jgi:hypothetical protein
MIDALKHAIIRTYQLGADTVENVPPTCSARKIEIPQRLVLNQSCALRQVSVAAIASKRGGGERNGTSI